MKNIAYDANVSLEYALLAELNALLHIKEPCVLNAYGKHKKIQ